jgi:hypothetical protein
MKFEIAGLAEDKEPIIKLRISASKDNTTFIFCGDNFIIASVNVHGEIYLNKAGCLQLGLKILD